MVTRYPTVDELARMDTQAVFDHIAQHLLAQGARSTHRLTGDCLYRSAKGRACAVGSIIPDAVYSAAFEHNRITRLFWLLGRPEFRTAHHEFFCDFLLANSTLLTQLMVIHDCGSPGLWSLALRDCADMFGLSAAVIDRYEGIVEPEARDGQGVFEPSAGIVEHEASDVLA
ncbi:hypothetical protein QFZ94_007505 [Paraburkholderia sp. JPY465]|uniref:hypothetical protein n=1 Tax=Paraburkholderia sp. JPY465 TaxID=3042285 RepID=UPI003D1AF70D